MKLGLLEVSGIKRVVEGKAHWERYSNRWVKFVDDDRPRMGMSEQEMHAYLENKICEQDVRRKSFRKYRIEVHGEAINIRKNKGV